MPTIRDEMRSTLVGALVLIFFVLMISDLFYDWYPGVSSAKNVEVCVELVDPAVTESLYHNEDSYPVVTRM